MINAAWRLVPRTPQRRRQPLLLVAAVFGIDPLFYCGSFGLTGLGPLFVLPLGVVQRRLRSRHQLLAPGALFLFRRLFLATLGVAPSLLVLEIRGSLAGVLLADLWSRSPFFGSGRRLLLRPPPASSPRLVGRPACSAKRLFDPAGRLRTTRRISRTT